jgi:hypothetical protein
VFQSYRNQSESLPWDKLISWVLRENENAKTK